MRKLTIKEQIRNDVIEECALQADKARDNAKAFYGVEESVGADIAARRIRALVNSAVMGHT
jgi:hypothetical protein